MKLMEERKQALRAKKGEERGLAGRNLEQDASSTDPSDLLLSARSPLMLPEPLKQHHQKGPNL